MFFSHFLISHLHFSLYHLSLYLLYSSELSICTEMNYQFISVARKRSLFDDSQDAEVQELTAIIRHDLTSLTQQLEELRKSTAVPSPSSTSHMQKHSANLLGSLQTKVANITSKFRDVLEVRTEVMFFIHFESMRGIQKVLR